MSFLDAIGPDPVTKRARAALSKEEAAMRAAQVGTRDDTCNTALFNLYQLVQAGEIGRDEVDGVMLDAALSTGFTEAEFEAKQRNAWASASPRTDKPRLAAVPSPPDLLAGLTTAAQIGKATYRARVHHVPNLITEGYTILGGSPKVGKSWFVLDLALAAAKGGLALGSISLQSRAVLYLALEDGHERLQDRMKTLNHGFPENLDILIDVEPGLGVETITAWLSTHKDDAHPPLVIVDTLSIIQPGKKPGEDHYRADYQFGHALKKAAATAPGAAIVAVHHTRKGAAEDFIHKLSGSVGVSSACDGVLTLTRERKSDYAVLSATGRDLKHEDDYSLVSRGGLWCVDGADLDEAAAAADTQRERGALADRSLDVLTFVQSRESSTPAEVAEHVGIPATQVGVYLTRLVESGRIVKLKRGLYGPTGGTLALGGPREANDAS